MNVAVLKEDFNDAMEFDECLREKARQIALTPCACEFCNNNNPYLLVCNKQCTQGIYEHLRKQAIK